MTGRYAEYINQELERLEAKVQSLRGDLLTSGKIKPTTVDGAPATQLPRTRTQTAGEGAGSESDEDPDTASYSESSVRGPGSRVSSTPSSFKRLSTRGKILRMDDNIHKMRGKVQTFGNRVGKQTSMWCFVDLLADIKSFERMLISVARPKRAELEQCLRRIRKLYEDAKALGLKRLKYRFKQIRKRLEFLMDDHFLVMRKAIGQVDPWDMQRMDELLRTIESRVSRLQEMRWESCNSHFEGIQENYDNQEAEDRYFKAYKFRKRNPGRYIGLQDRMRDMRVGTKEYQHKYKCDLCPRGVSG